MYTRCVTRRRKWKRNTGSVHYSSEASVPGLVMLLGENLFTNRIVVQLKSIVSANLVGKNAFYTHGRIKNAVRVCNLT